mgnify:CR=1 FL=1
MTKDEEDALVTRVMETEWDERELRLAIRAAVAHEHEANLKAIQALIREGPLQGNGWDDTAQRNGIILAYNTLAEIRRGE